MKKRILCLFVLVLACVFAAPASGEGIRYEGPGFDTPEEALTCYVEGIKELDFEKILSAFAWETQASHYSVKKQIERARSFSVSMKPRIPSDHPFAVTANLESLRSLQVDNLYKSLEFLMMGEHYHNNMAVSLREDAEIAAFLDYFDDSRLDLLTGMTNVRFIAPEFVAGGVFLSEKNQEMFAKRQQFTARMRYGISSPWRIWKTGKHSTAAQPLPVTEINGMSYLPAVISACSWELIRPARLSSAENWIQWGSEPVTVPALSRLVPV